jgi:hypothetical protein
MSLEIYLQAFESGDSAERDGEPVRRLLLAHAVAQDPEHSFVRVASGSDSADVHGVPDAGEPVDGLMFSRVEGRAFELIFEVARAAGLVVMPVGCPVCVAAEAQIAHLPEDLAADGVVQIAGGDQLREIIEDS